MESFRIRGRDSLEAESRLKFPACAAIHAGAVIASSRLCSAMTANPSHATRTRFIDREIVDNLLS